MQTVVGRDMKRKIYKEEVSRKPVPLESVSFVEQPLLKSVASLFFPLLIATGVSSGIGISDVYLSGLIGPAAQAAVGIGDQIIFLSVMLGTGLATACSSFVARAIGGGRHDEAAQHARNSFLIAILTGLAATYVGIAGAPQMVSLFNANTTVTDLSIPYIQICSWANIPYMLLMSMAATMRASGRPRAALAVWLTTSALTVTGSFAFFFVEGLPCTRSITSIAWAWIFGAAIGMALGIYLVRGLIFSKIAIQFDNKFWILFGPLLLTTAPAVLSELFMVLSNITTYRLLSAIPDSTQLQAAWAVKLKVEQILAIVPMLALSFACEVIVGQHTGAGLFSQARDACKRIVIWGGFALLIIGAGVAFASDFMSAQFCIDAAERHALSELLGSAFVILPSTAVTMLICAGLDGQGKMLMSMLINLIIFALKVFFICIAIEIFAGGVSGLVVATGLASLAGAAMALHCFCRHCAEQPRVTVMDARHVP